MEGARITWLPEPNGHAHHGYLNGVPMFAIHHVPRNMIEPDKPWMLATCLPGLDDRIARGTDPDQLKGTAEDWLGVFVASIGATFTDQH